MSVKIKFGLEDPSINELRYTVFKTQIIKKRGESCNLDLYLKGVMDIMGLYYTDDREEPNMSREQWLKLECLTYIYTRGNEEMYNEIMEMLMDVYEYNDKRGKNKIEKERSEGMIMLVWEGFIHAMDFREGW